MKYKTQTEQRIDCLAHDISPHHGQICMINKTLKYRYTTNDLIKKRELLQNEKTKLENKLITINKK